MIILFFDASFSSPPFCRPISILSCLIIYFLIYLLSFSLHSFIVGQKFHWRNPMNLTFLQYFVDYKLTSPYTRDANLPYATYFLQYIGFAAQVPNVIFNWLNVFLNPR